MREKPLKVLFFLVFLSTGRSRDLIELSKVGVGIFMVMTMKWTCIEKLKQARLHLRNPCICLASKLGIVTRAIDTRPPWWWWWWWLWLWLIFRHSGGFSKHGWC